MVSLLKSMIHGIMRDAACTESIVPVTPAHTNSAQKLHIAYLVSFSYI